MEKNLQLKCMMRIKKLKLELHKEYLTIALYQLCKLNSIKNKTFRIAPYAYFPEHGFAYIYYDRGVLKKELPEIAKQMGFGKREVVEPRKAAKLIVDSHSKLEGELYTLVKKLLIFVKTIKRREHAGHTSI